MTCAPRKGVAAASVVAVSTLCLLIAPTSAYYFGNWWFGSASGCSPTPESCPAQPAKATGEGAELTNADGNYFTCATNHDGQQCTIGSGWTAGANWASGGSSTRYVFSFQRGHDVYGFTVSPKLVLKWLQCTNTAVSMSRDVVTNGCYSSGSRSFRWVGGVGSCIPGYSQAAFYMDITTSGVDVCVYESAAISLWGIDPHVYDGSESLGVSFRSNGVSNPSVTVKMYWRARSGNNEVGIFDVLNGGVGASYSGGTTTNHNIRMVTPSCKQGWYAYGATCVKCPAGTYGPAPFIAGVESCVPCPAGTFNTQAGQAMCATCEPGYRSTIVGMTVDCNTAPYRCDAGYFGKAVNMTTCKGCTDPDVCGLCPAGTYRTHDMPGDACVDCSGMQSCQECEPTTGVQYIKGQRQNAYQACLIAGLCVDIDATRPKSNSRDYIAACQACTPTDDSRALAYTDVPGLGCDDGNLCTRDDTCGTEGQFGCYGTPFTCLNTETVTTDSHCEDCDGSTCVANNRGCVTTHPTTGAKMCGCFIDNVCYYDGQPHPDSRLSQCNVCNRKLNLTGWTPLPDQTCNDNDMCTHTDTCRLQPFNDGTLTPGDAQTQRYQCQGDAITCAFPVCTNQPSWRDACSGLPTGQCSLQTYYSLGQNYTCREENNSQCIRWAACDGVGACPTTNMYVDPAITATDLQLSAPSYPPPTDEMGGEAILAWPHDSFLRVTLTTTRVCGDYNFTAYIMEDTTQNCATMEFNAVNSLVPHVDVERDGATVTLTLQRCDTGVTLNDCTWFDKLPQGKLFHLAVEVTTNLYEPEVVAFVGKPIRQCLTDVVVDTTAPVAPPNVTVITPLDPYTNQPALFHHAPSLKFTWEPFLDPESGWGPGHADLSYMPVIHYYDTVLQTLNGVTVPSFNKVVKTFYWQAASAYPDGVLSFQTSPLPIISSRYFVTVAGRKYYLSVRVKNAAGRITRYQHSVSVMLDFSDPITTPVYDGPSPPSTHKGAVDDLDGFSGKCVAVHWAGGFHDDIGNDPQHANIRSYTFEILRYFGGGVGEVTPQFTVAAANVALGNGRFGYTWCYTGSNEWFTDPGSNVTTTVTATNIAGLSSSASTNGMKFDVTPPVFQSGSVIGGLIGWDIQNKTWRASTQGRHSFSWEMYDPEWPDRLAFSYEVFVQDSGGKRSVGTGEVAHPFSRATFESDDLDLEDGAVILTSVTGLSPAALSTTSSLPTVTVDTSPPYGVEVYVVDTSRDMVPGTVTAVAFQPKARTFGCEDPQSGVQRVEVSLVDAACTAFSGCTVLWSTVHLWGGDQETAVDGWDSIMVSGTRYRFEATCVAGSTATTTASAEFWFETQGPQFGTATVGVPSGPVIEFQCDPDAAYVWWNGFDGRNAGIESYTATLVAVNGGAEVLSQSSNNTVTAMTFDVSATPLGHDLEYKFTVQAFSHASGIGSPVIESPTFLVDLTDPEVGALDVKLTNASRRVDLTWDGSWTDPESQIAKYRWWVGTTNSTADIYGPIELEPSLLTATALVPAKIQSHRAVYVTLEAVNRAGCGSTKYVVDIDNRFLDFGNATALDSWRGRFSALSERELTESFYVRDPSYVNSWWYNITDEQGVQRFDVGFVATNSSRGYDPDCTLTLTGVYHGAPGFGKATFHTAAAESLVYGQTANGFLPGEGYRTYVQGSKDSAPSKAFCSRGFRVDVDAPEAPSLGFVACTQSLDASTELPGEQSLSTDGLAALWSLARGREMSCRTQLHAEPYWPDFVDRESGVIQYVWAVGTQPSGAQAAAFQVYEAPDARSDSNATTRAPVANVTVPGANVVTSAWDAMPALTEGQRYYTTVIATSGAGRNTTSVSQPFWVDTSPPLILGATTIAGTGFEQRPLDSRPPFDNRAAHGVASAEVLFGDAQRSWYVKDAPVDITCGWGPVADHESGVSAVVVSLLLDGETVVSSRVELDASTPTNGTTTFVAADMPGAAFASAGWYQCEVTAVNNANVTTSLVSEAVVVDSTAPVAGVVYDGPLHNWMDGDIDVQAQNGTLSAYWSGFYDFEATISHYMVAVGTGSSGAELEDVVAFTNVGRVNAWTSTPDQLLVSLAKGVKYFVTVRAVSHTGRTVDSSSDGVVIGIAPPMPVEAGWVSMRGIPLASTDRTTCGCSIANAEFSDREGRCRCPSGYALNLTSTPEGAVYSCEVVDEVPVFPGDNVEQLDARYELMYGAAGLRGLVASPVVKRTTCADSNLNSDLIVGPNNTCMCPPGHYRIIPDSQVCLPCPYGSYKWLPGDSPHLCRPCWVAGFPTLRLSFNATAPLIDNGGTLPQLTGMSWVVGSGTRGAQFAAGAQEFDPAAVPTRDDRANVIVPLGVEEGAMVTAHGLPVFDSVVDGTFASASLPVLDNTPPTAGWVNIGDLKGGEVYRGNGSLTVVWGAFSDDLGVVRLQVAIGLTPGGDSVLPFYTPDLPDGVDVEEFALSGNATDVPFPWTSSILHVYATVRVFNTMGMWTSVSSSVSFIDVDPPVVEHVTLATEQELEVHNRFVVAASATQSPVAWRHTDHIRVIWQIYDPDEMDTDAPAIRYTKPGSSQVARIEWAIGTVASPESVQAFTAVPDLVSAGAVASGLDLQQGETYVVTVRATDGLGQQSAPRTSSPFVVDTEQPVGGRVAVLASGHTVSKHYGHPLTLLDLVPVADVEYESASANESIAAIVLPATVKQAHSGETHTTVEWSWEAAGSASGLASCLLHLSTSVESVQLIESISLRAAHCYGHKHHLHDALNNLEHGTVFWAHLQVTSTAGLSSVTTSPPIIIDRTPPVGPEDGLFVTIKHGVVIQYPESVSFPDSIQSFYRSVRNQSSAPVGLTQSVMFHDSSVEPLDNGMQVSWDHWGEDLTEIVRYDVALQVIDPHTWGWLEPEWEACGTVGLGLCPSEYDTVTSVEAGATMATTLAVPSEALPRLLFEVGFMARIVVRAVNAAGLTTSAASVNIHTDSTPPLISGVRVGGEDVAKYGTHMNVQRNNTAVHTAWYMVDYQSRINGFMWAIVQCSDASCDGNTWDYYFWTKPNVVGIAQAWTLVEGLDIGSCASATNLNLATGGKYHVLVTVRNVLNQWSAVTASPWFVVDPTPPIPGRLYVGEPRQLLSANRDRDGYLGSCWCTMPFGTPVLDASGGGNGKCECVAGYFFNETTSQCVQCPAGTYKPEAGVAPESCVTCPPGTSPNAASTGCQCPGGNTMVHDVDSNTCVCAAGYEVVGADCVACPAGMAKPHVGNATCQACMSVGATTTTGATECACGDPTIEVFEPSEDSFGLAGLCVCKPGYFNNSYTGTCVRCPVHTYKAVSGSRGNLCKRCPSVANVDATGTTCVCPEHFTFDATTNACDHTPPPLCLIDGEPCVDQQQLFAEAVSSQLQEDVANAKQQAANTVVDAHLVAAFVADGSAAFSQRTDVSLVADNEPFVPPSPGARDVSQAPCLSCLGTCDEVPSIGAGQPVFLRWDGFWDPQSFINGDLTTVALGTVPYGEQIRAFTPISQFDLIPSATGQAFLDNYAWYGSARVIDVPAGAVMNHTNPVFATIKVHNYAGAESVSTEWVGIVDATPPAGCVITPRRGIFTHQVGEDPVWIMPLNAPLAATLSGCVDPETDIDKVSWRVTLSPDGSRTVWPSRNYTWTPGLQGAPATPEPVVDGRPRSYGLLGLHANDVPSYNTPAVPHYFVATISNGADLVTTVVSDGFYADGSAPIAGSVRDGVALGSDMTCGVLQLNNSVHARLGANWDPWIEDETDPVTYTWALGTACGLDDIQPFSVVDGAVAQVASGVDTAAGEVPVLTASANVSRVLNWARQEEAKDVHEDEHVRRGQGASSVFVVATVRGYNAVGAYSEACSDGVRLMVADCSSTNEEVELADGEPRNTFVKFLCGQHRDFLCMPVQTVNPWTS